MSFPEMTGDIGSESESERERDGAFQRCVALVSVDFPSMRGNIREEAFRMCRNLTSAIFPLTTGIQPKAFDGCLRLGESNPEETVVFSGALDLFANNPFDESTGISIGRDPVELAGDRLLFGNGTSGVYVPKVLSVTSTDLQGPHTIAGIYTLQPSLKEGKAWWLRTALHSSTEPQIAPPPMLLRWASQWDGGVWGFDIPNGNIGGLVAFSAFHLWRDGHLGGNDYLLYRSRVVPELGSNDFDEGGNLSSGWYHGIETGTNMLGIDNVTIKAIA